jgi:hypothetical protein
MGDDRKDVQPAPVELWSETRPVVGRSSSFDPLYPYKEPYQVAVVLGRGKLAKIEVAETKWEVCQAKLLGEQLRKEGVCRGLDIRAVKFVSQLSEFQTKDLQWIEEVLEGECTLRAKTARERRGRHACELVRVSQRPVMDSFRVLPCGKTSLGSTNQR